MAQLRQDFINYQKQDGEILVVGPENSTAFKKYWKENNLPYNGLPDPKHTVLKLYGQEIKLFKLGRMPSQFLIDKDGIVRFIHMGGNMADISENKEILRILGEINRRSY